MARHGGPQASEQRRERTRRDVNLTAVIVAVVIVGGVVVLGYLAVMLELARQGLDVRSLVRVRLGPDQWGWLAVVAGGTSGAGFLVKRSNRTERLVGRDVPALVRDALAAQRADLVTDLAATLGQVLREHRDTQRATSRPVPPAADTVDRLAVLLAGDPEDDGIDYATPTGPSTGPSTGPLSGPLPRQLTTGEWNALVHGR